MTGRLSAAARDQLCDSVVHAAATALIVTASAAGAGDAVRAQTAAAVYPLIHDAAAGDGGQARRRAGALTSLVDGALTELDGSAGPHSALVLALERWLLHPQRRTAAELVAAARELARTSADEELLERAWLTGAGVERAVATLRNGDLDGETEIPARSLVAAACEHVVPVVWVARELDVARNAVYRSVRSIAPQAWRVLLP